MAKNNKSRSRNKHIDIKYLVVRKHIKDLDLFCFAIKVNLWRSKVASKQDTNAASIVDINTCVVTRFRHNI